MTIDKLKLQIVLSAANIAGEKVSALMDVVDETDPDNQFNSTFTNIFENLESVEAWANQKLLEAEQDEVMGNFLGELKLVFDKYSATISTMAFEDGYGVGYGEPGTGFLLTASLDGVTSTKEIKKAVIGTGDLV